ncbi:MAG: efflux RND transporter permease subunit [Planctomycetota bacterium]|nr:efflux RND transporter permease subunit [Planctomycetota bacterium]
MKLPEIGVRQPVFTTMMYTAVLVLGIVSFSYLPLDLLPEIEMPAISVITTYPGAAAKDVEISVTKIIENDLGIVGNLDEIMSTSSEGLSTVTCKFKWGTSLDEASNEIRDRLEFSKRRLPEDIVDPIIFKFNTAMFPILGFGVTAGESWGRLVDIAKDQIADELASVTGVGAVMVIGGRQRQFNVKLDRQKLEAYGITVQQVEAAIRGENYMEPAGNLKIGKLDYILRIPGEYVRAREIGNTVVKKSRGALVYLKDLAEIEDGFEEQTLFVEVDGRKSLMVIVQKRSGENTVAVIESVRKRLKEIGPSLPEDVTVAEIFSNADLINQSIDNLKGSVVGGGILVVLVTFLFLRRVRTSLIIVLTIPFSLIITFIAMYVFNFTINMMSLAALALAIGMVVDNGIVVLDNISRWVDAGKDPATAAIGGASEVGLAISASTFTTVVVFLPLIFVKGITGIIFTQLGSLISIALLASLFTAISFTPMLCSRLLGRSKEPGRFYVAGERYIGALEQSYRGSLAFALRHKTVVIVLTIVLFAGSIALIPFIGTEFFPEEDTGDLQITIETQVGTRVEETFRVAKDVMEIFKRQASKEMYRTFIRSGTMRQGVGFGFKQGSYIGLCGAKLKKKAQRARTTKEVAYDIEKYLKDVPGIVKVKIDPGNPMSAMLLGGGKPFCIEILGNDLAVTDALAAQLRDIVARVPGAVNVTISRDVGKPEIVVIPDKEKAATFGISTLQIAQTLRTYFYGRETTQFREAGNEYDIFVQLDESYRGSLQDLKDAHVVSPLTGESVPISAIAEVKLDTGYIDMERKNQRRRVKVEADTHGRSLGEITTDVEAAMKTVAVPPGVTVQFGGMVVEQRKAFSDIFILLALGIALVYMVMASQFESFLQPFIIMFTVPFALVGVVFALLLGGFTVSVASLIGFVMLVGIVVNNGIILIDAINRRRAVGEAADEAILTASMRRLRPILITNLTTIFGMLPLAISTGEGSEVWGPIGSTVIGGLFVSMMVTLILIPVVYRMLAARKEPVGSRQ